MVGAHAVLGYALVSGMAGKAIETFKKPLEATIIAEVKLPPPPPPSPPPPPAPLIEKIHLAPKTAAPPPAHVPPPEVPVPPSAAPAITAVQTTQAVTPPLAALAPAPSPPAPPAAIPSFRVDMALVCPIQVKPEIPKKAIDDGVEGDVKAEVKVRGGKVIDVRIISGPGAYHVAVRAALARYECSNGGAEEIIATQDFTFKLK